MKTSCGVSRPSSPATFRPFKSTVMMSRAVTNLSPDSSGPRALIRMLSSPGIRALTWPLGSLVKLSLPRIRHERATCSRRLETSAIEDLVGDDGAGLERLDIILAAEARQAIRTGRPAVGRCQEQAGPPLRWFQNSENFGNRPPRRGDD